MTGVSPAFVVQTGEMPLNTLSREPESVDGRQVLEGRPCRAPASEEAPQIFLGARVRGLHVPIFLQHRATPFLE